jgi:hypothetical protein
MRLKYLKIPSGLSSPGRPGVSWGDMAFDLCKVAQESDGECFVDVSKVSGWPFHSM